MAELTFNIQEIETVEEVKVIPLPIYMSQEDHPSERYIRIDENKVVTIIELDSGFSENNIDNLTAMITKAKLSDMHEFSGFDSPLKNYRYNVDESKFLEALKNANFIITHHAQSK